MSLRSANDAGEGALQRASIAVDLGAGSCRVSLLRWLPEGPVIELVHRFANTPVAAEDGSLRWPMREIIEGVEQGLRLCAQRAPEGVQSIGVDGWAVDYVRVDAEGRALEEPFCYRDERNEAAQNQLHEIISSQQLREITGLQLQKFNTLYQLYADRLADRNGGVLWLNLPEYLLSRWSGVCISEYTNAMHTEMLDVASGEWSQEILQAAGIDPAIMPRIVEPGTVLGRMQGPLAELAAFRETMIVAPACHDTASAVAGIPARGDDWGYISCGTWSLVGTPVSAPVIVPAGEGTEFTNIGLDRELFLLQRNMNGLWLLSSCQEEWLAEGQPWEINDLCAAARRAPVPDALLDLGDPALQGVGDMPGRINEHLAERGEARVDATSAGAPAMAALIFHSLAASYARIFSHLEQVTRKTLRRIYLVGGGSQNAFLRELIAQRTGKEVIAGAAESSTVGNFALQLAALQCYTTASERRRAVREYAEVLAPVSPVQKP